MFRTYDLNQDNFLDVNELKALVKDLGYDYSQMEDPEKAFNDHVEYLFHKYDKNGD